MNHIFQTTDLGMDMAAVSERVRLVMALTGNIPSVPNPDVRVTVLGDIPFAGVYSPERNLVALRPEMAFGPQQMAILAHELTHAHQGLWGDVAATRPGPAGLVRYALCPFEQQARRVEATAALLKGKFLTTSPEKLVRATKLANVVAGATELYLIGVAVVAAKVDRRWRRKLLEPFGFWREE